ncbi:MAG: glycosyltransferase family 4 protein [Acidimicrobiia bacterium]|nr:glycosyltransferase family 4 protein [Acidimicrobiia bacterium]
MGEPVRVGVVVKTFPKLSETFILEELLGLEREGLDLEVFSLQRPTDDRTHAQNAELRASVHYAPSSLRVVVGHHIRLFASHPLGYIRTLAKSRVASGSERRRAFAEAGWLGAEAERLGLSHLHVHFLNAPTTVAELAASATGLPFSVSAHAKDIYLTPEDELERKLDKASFAVTCTEHNQKYLSEITTRSVQCVHHGVQLDLFAPKDEVPHKPVLLAVGRLREKKGFDLLIEACSVLRQDGVAFECRIVGYGPEDRRLEQLIEERDLGDHASLLGACTRSEVIAQYEQASMLVQPCRITDDGDRDGIPNVLLEAMAMRLPVISTRVSGIPELIRHRDNGLLVEQEDVDGLVSAIRQVLDDAELGRSLGRAARATIENEFSSDRSAKRIAEQLRPAHIAYVVKGYPRLSELFIADEIHRMEQLGHRLRLLVLKPADEPVQHAIVEEIRAAAVYLPRLTSISKAPLTTWLRTNLPNYQADLVSVARRSPLGFTRAVADASRQSWRARRGRRPRKVYLKEFFQAAAVARNVLDEPGVLHLHAHFGHGATTVTWLAATMSRRTFSFTGHAKDIYRQDLNPAGLLARKMRAAEFVATCTKANHQHLAAVEPTADVRTIYHGLNEEFSRLLTQETMVETHTSSPSDPLRIVSVGRLVPKKGIDLLIRSVAELRDQDVPVIVRVLGEDGDEGDRLRLLASELNVDDLITFVGPVTQSALFAEYRSADVFCLPCRILDDGDRDGIPNVLAEAMAAGLAVVSTPISGIPELVDDRSNGLLVPSEDSSALAKALSELHRDLELRRRLGAASRETISQRFDGWKGARMLAEQFDQVLRR